MRRYYTNLELRAVLRRGNYSVNEGLCDQVFDLSSGLCSRDADKEQTSASDGLRLR